MWILQLKLAMISTLRVSASFCVQQTVVHKLLKRIALFGNLCTQSELMESEQDGVSYVEKNAEKRPRLTFVDATGSGSNFNVRDFNPVGAGMPSDLVRDAIKLTDSKQVPFPWEKGRLKKIFSDQPLVESILPKVKASSNNFVRVQVAVGEGSSLSTSIEVEHRTSDKALYMSAVKSFRGGSYIEERESRRLSAVDLWWTLLRICLKSSDPGRAAEAEATADAIDSYGKEVLSACFALKSPNTLLKRYYSLKSFSDWMCERGHGDWLPFSESCVWRYLQFLRVSSAPPTKGSSFVEAVRFGHFVLRIDGAEEVLSSLRVRGLSAQLFANKRPWHPADPLTAAEVIRMHSAMCDDGRSLYDRVIIGHLLHMIYSRSRWSDLLAVSNVYLDESSTFLEAVAYAHKGAKSSDKKTRLLPIVAPAVGIAGKCWAEDYLELRGTAGLTCPGDNPSFMLPAPSKAGSDGWTSRYLTSQEANSFLRVLFPDAGGRRLTTHSMKATALSWAAKCGVSGEDRAILARHQSSIQGSTVLYSRDIVSAALRKFQKVIALIRDEAFVPDANRSGMVTPRPVATPTVVPATPTLAAQVVGEVPDASPTAEELGWEHVSSYSPGSPPRDGIPAAVKLEPGEVANHGGFARNETVNLIEEEAGDWLLRWSDSSSSSEGSGQESTSEDDEQQPEPEVPAFRVSNPHVSETFINVSSLVIHKTKDARKFRCGRLVGTNYVRAHEPCGFECSRCFT